MGECRVTALDVRKAISKLKSGKSCGIDGFMSDHIIHASDKFCVIVGMLINAMLTYGHNPSQLLNIVVKSIPKDMRGSLCYEIIGFTRRSGVSATFAKTTVHTSNIHFVCPPICTGTFPIFAQVKQNTAFLSFECSS